MKAKTDRLVVRLPDGLRTKLAALAEARGESLSLVVREAMRDYVATHASKPDAGGSAGSNAGSHGEISLIADRAGVPVVSEPLPARERVSYRKAER